MKKTLLLLVLAFYLVLPGKAQPVSSYEFTSSQGTYTPLGSETVLWEETFDNHTETITIPSFNISGSSYTSMTVSSNGFITFGGNAPSATYYRPISGTGAYNAAVSPMGIRLENAESGEPKISYNTNADGEIVVQWQDVKRQAVTGDVISFQIRLNPSTGTVRFIYGNVSTSYTGTGGTVQVGLRGSSRDDFNNRTTLTDWSATGAGTAPTVICRLNNDVYPPSGLTFAWTPPPACEEPVAQPGGLALSAVTTVRIDGSFTAAGGTDSYLVVRSTEANLSENPSDGTTYDEGHTLGNGTVVYSGTETSFSSRGLTQGTEYHFFVFSMNALCSDGPLYLTTEPLSGSKHTVPSSPSSFTATATGTSEISLEAVTSHDVVVAWNTVNTFGNPSGSYSAGDPLIGGGTIFYAGPPQDMPVHTGLASGQRYFYRCWTVAGEVYSSTTTSNDITSAAIPFFDGFEEGNSNNSEVINWLHSSSSFFTFTAQNNITTNNRAPRSGDWSAAANRNCWIFKPVQLAGGQVYRLMMYARQNTEIPEDAAITVGYGTEGTGAGMTETLLEATQLLDGGYQLIESYFSPADEGRFYLGINSIVPSMGTMVFITIDDISLEEGPAFPPPTMLSAGNITSSSADITWNQHGTAAQWNLKYGIPGFDPATEGSLITGIDGSSHTLESLSVMTEYEVRMQAVEGTETSDWSEPLIFSTKVDPLSGNFTIDASQPTSGNNFNSFGDMARYLMDGGVNGPVVVDVVANSGPYSEQVIIRAIEGTSAENTVTINGNGNTLEYLSENSDERATLKLDGASYIRFDNLEIKALGGGTGQYGWGVHLLNNADNNQFINCSITVPWASNNTNFAGIVAANSSTLPWTAGEAAANLVISNCTVTGGFFGIIINGPTNVSVHMNLTITDTDVKDFYSTGIRLSHQRGATIEGNRIYREDSSPLISPTYMLHISDNMTGTRVVSNRIFNPAGNATSNQARDAIGIMGGSIAADSENKLLIANNMIYGFRYMNQLQGGIRIGGNNTRIYHNTIALDYAERSSNANLYGIGHTGANAGMEIVNNIIYINSGGTGDKWCLEYATTTGIAASNNNVLFMDTSAGTRNYTGRFGNTNYTSLDEWQATELDLNSLRYDPLFVEDPSEPLVPRHYKIKGAGANLLSAVPADIDGNERTTTPDPGARQYEAACISPEGLFGRNNYNARGEEAWTSWSPVNNEDLWSVEYGLQGFSQGSGTTVETGIMPYVIAGLEPDASYDFYVRAHCGDLLSDWSDPETFTLFPDLTTPFFEDFDELEDGDLPPGWSSIPAESELVKVQTNHILSYSPPNSMELTASVEVLLISPELEEEISGLWMSFQARRQHWSSPLEIGSVNSPGEPETFTLISSVELTSGYENYDVYMHM